VTTEIPAWAPVLTGSLQLNVLPDRLNVHPVIKCDGQAFIEGVAIPLKVKFKRWFLSLVAIP